VDGGKVGVFEEGDKVSFGGFLESHDGGRLETKVGLEVLGNLTNETLEGKLADKQLGRLLVTSDFSQRHCTRAESVRLLDTTSGSGGCLASGLGSELFTRGFASGGLAGGLFGAGHWDDTSNEDG